MDQQKLNFISTGLIAAVKKLPVDAIPKWGKMNAQQMVEHVAGFFSVSTNKLHFPVVTPEEHLPKYKEFLHSEKEFRENTKAPILPEEPLPLHFGNLGLAIGHLEKEVKDFITLFEGDPAFITQHPVFGNLNYEEWILLHYKHVLHHLKQFELVA